VSVPLSVSTVSSVPTAVPEARFNNQSLSSRCDSVILGDSVSNTPYAYKKSAIVCTKTRQFHCQEQEQGVEVGIGSGNRTLAIVSPLTINDNETRSIAVNIGVGIVRCRSQRHQDESEGDNCLGRSKHPSEASDTFTAYCSMNKTVQNWKDRGTVGDFQSKLNILLGNVQIFDNLLYAADKRSTIRTTYLTDLI
jgi:hypothetical protein